MARVTEYSDMTIAVDCGGKLLNEQLHEKPIICICENKGADQLRSNREADQRLCFCYTDSTIPPQLISKISSL